MKQLADTLGVHQRWLPPAEHAEKLAQWVGEGRCRVMHRGHGVAPALEFEDGGSMELPSVRWALTSRGHCLVSISDVHSEEKTTHSDVCGTVDAMKEAIAGEPDVTGLQEFLDDIEHMIRRMKKRRDEYDQFTEQLREAFDTEIRRKPVPPAFDLLDDLREALSQSSSQISANHDDIVVKAEKVRDIAQYLEYSLADYKKMVLEINRLCREIRGGRSWPDFTAGG